MKETAENEGCLYQDHVANTLLEHDDDRLAYWDDMGSLCVGKEVLAAFRAITPDYVYERSTKLWRKREEYDLPGRMQS